MPARHAKKPDGNPVGRPREIAGEAAESHLHLRVQRSRKVAYVRAAQSSNRTLAAWSLEHLDRASGYEAAKKY